MLSLFSLLLIIAGAAAHAHDEPLCQEPGYKIKAPPVAQAPESVAALLNPEEAADAESGRKLVAKPGPYGHSEMGFRYLARLFGYPGEFRGREGVERWVAEQEVNRPAENRGLRKLWDRWVVNAPKRLATPVGPVRKIPADGSPEVFFRDLYEKAEHTRCVQQEIATLRCENYLGGRTLQSTDHVYFGRAGGRGFCAAYARGSITNRAPDSETVTEEYSMGYKDPSRKVRRVWQSQSGVAGAGGGKGAVGGAQ